MAKKSATPRPRRTAAIKAPAEAGPELIVILKEEGTENAAPVRAGRARSAGGSNVARVMRRAGATLTPLFGVSEERVVAERAAASRRAGAPLPHLEKFYRVDAPTGALRTLARDLAEQPEVEAAYVKPPT